MEEVISKTKVLTQALQKEELNITDAIQQIWEIWITIE